ncbi:hypothetical protein AB0J63_24655 [Streptosporangium canum]|uniref:hypothetical protein n=1 Tax=Streptosporangium canum TaxID=324952 RepID=UPI0034341A6E
MAAEQVGRLLDQTFAAVSDGISLSSRGPAVPFDEIGQILGGSIGAARTLAGRARGAAGAARRTASAGYLG